MDADAEGSAPLLNDALARKSTVGQRNTAQNVTGLNVVRREGDAAGNGKP